ncbi:hypothetical protein BCR37DRAFT_414031 [Protomyces lactucae-debilis]|uniref:J domain-containing protein n=1 Tax=Protomyces lactucae-debilis TaxID=2754530 RepID=A0A1Y2FDC6_PROLT|nr:uncharacterized protein BCR37DRAFT_414031 [Protomyces lactucae-debilis]ORY81607.1 hypothetical protein BCR37DRAFT_414031 [Protomyces lactucae-debilis]
MAAQQAIDQLNLYELLDASQDASNKELQKAFRKQAIRFHPDKNPSVEAATRFHLLTIAIDTLLDPTKRQLYDTSIKAAQVAAAQKAKIEGERRAWINALETNEEQARTSLGDRKRKRDEDDVRQATLVQQGAELRAALASKRIASSVTEPTTIPAGAVDTTLQSVFTSEDRTLKVRFSRRANSVESLKELFGQFGRVRELVYKPREGKSQSALVEFDQIGSALAAIQGSPDMFPGIGFKSCGWAFNRDSNVSMQGDIEGNHNKKAEPKKQRLKQSVNAAAVG